MRFCEKCGKEIPDGETQCTCYYEQDLSADTAQTDDEFSDVIKDTKITNILGIVVLLLGIVSVLFINGWLGAVMFLVAELFVLVPNSKLQKLFKTKNATLDKKTRQANLKALTKRLKEKNKGFKISFLIGYVALALLIISFIVPSPLIGTNNKSKDDIDVSSNEYEDVNVSNEYEDVNVSSNEYEEDVDITIESNENIKATSFIRRNNFEIYETIKPYCKQIGYDFDSWMVYTNTQECLELHGSYSENQLVLILESQFTVQMNNNFFVTGQGNEGFVVITGKVSEADYVFGFVDALFAECPEELKYTGQYLKDNYEANVINGTATFEKEGVKYKVTYVPTTSLWMITLDVR